MMKKRLICFFTMLVICLCTLTGCIRYQAEVEIMPNGCLNVTMEYSTMKELYDQIGDYMDMQPYKDAGFSVLPYDDGDYKGYRMEKLNYDPASANLPEDSIDKQFAFKKKDDGCYRVAIPVSALYGNRSASDFASMREVVKSQNGYMKLTVKLPCEPEYSNATYQNGNEMTWDLLQLTGDELVVEFKYNFFLHRLFSDYLFIVIAVGAVLLVLIVFITVLAVRKKRNSNYGYY